MVVPLEFGWHHLLFANWPVDHDVLSAHVPDQLALDEYDGAGWLSVVAFVNEGVRPTGVPKWLGVRVPQVNLRTYVVRDGEPGIYLFSLDAGGLLAVLGGRLFHHLPYFYARSSLRREGDRVAFSSRRRHPGARPARFSATCRPTDESFVAEPGSLADFLAERRRLFAQASNGSLRHSDVTHERFDLHHAEVTMTDNTLFEANGFDHPDADPTHYYSPGVDVMASRSRRWEKGRGFECVSLGRDCGGRPAAGRE